jgi:hypothetical protein
VTIADAWAGRKDGKEEQEEKMRGRRWIVRGRGGG